MTSSSSADALARPRPTAQEGPPAHASPMKITVESKSGILDYACEVGENLLYAGLAAGVGLPYECGTGTCGTCRARVMSGEAELAWDKAPGLAYVKRDKGEILLCQAHARSDCTVRVPAKIGPPSRPYATPARNGGVIAKAVRLTHDVMHFEVALDAPMAYDAGQFVVVSTPAVTGGRAYSMVNYAPGGRQLDLVVKRKPGGGFSEWLFASAIEGSRLDLFGPLGRATFHPDEDRNPVCIAGGSGIAGMLAIASRACQEGYFSSHRGHVFFGVRTLADCFYMDELSCLVARSGGNLEVTVALSHEEAASEVHRDFRQIRLASGFVHEVAAKSMAGRFENAIGFVAGPPPMVDGALRMLIMEARLPAQFIRYDKFG
jgi:toluene monooxygenase electron transfer component